MPKTALILGAGGLSGEAYEAGVLLALEEGMGFDARRADVIVGTSAGSYVGAMLRFGLSSRDLFAYVVGEPLSPRGQEIFDGMGPIPDVPVFKRPRFRAPSRRLIASAVRHPLRSRAGVLAAAIPVGQIDTAPYANVLRRFTGTDWCDGNLWVVATKLPLGERVVFGRGETRDCDVPEAVAASCAIPGIFVPVRIGDETYIDGAVHSPSNADLVAENDCDEVIVVSPMSADRRSTRTGRVNPMRLLCRAILGAEVRRLRRAGKHVTVYHPTLRLQRLMGMNALDEERCVDVAKAARAITQARIAKTEDIGLAA